MKPVWTKDVHLNTDSESETAPFIHSQISKTDHAIVRFRKFVNYKQNCVISRGWNSIEILKGLANDLKWLWLTGNECTISLTLDSSDIQFLFYC